MRPERVSPASCMLPVVTVVVVVASQAQAVSPKVAGQSPYLVYAITKHTLNALASHLREKRLLEHAISESEQIFDKCTLDLDRLTGGHELIRKSLHIKRCILEEFEDKYRTLSRARLVRPYLEEIRKFQSECSDFCMGRHLMEIAHVDNNFWRRLEEGRLGRRALRTAMQQDLVIVDGIFNATRRCQAEDTKAFLHLSQLYNTEDMLNALEPDFDTFHALVDQRAAALLPPWIVAHILDVN
ncbi:unnamed protein product (mitochondrion) [Plasmodiophora brassicae]|uniref:Uncharacterized protein n=1 Tax=Plasmodiophora brassicae TaxID=37360 RepID=A0A0G4J3Z3_PLABS|nr:hypothetical protein PBRA_008932 [Plasmodiophora brassicae]SPQ93727.1 unnamed protein product [Plasmodiophora brassicae]